jgi:hypothetical protein
MKVALVTMVAAAALSAQVFEAGAHGGVSRLSSRNIGTVPNSDGSRASVALDDGWRFGFRVTLNNYRFMGQEFGYAYNRTRLRIDGVDSGGTAIHQGLFNWLLYATKEGARVRPFATGGGHFSNFIVPGASVTSGGGDNKIGVNYGGGIKVRMNDRFLIRLDARQYVNGKPFDLRDATGALKQMEISIGFSFYMM